MNDLYILDSIYFPPEPKIIFDELRF